MPQATSSRAPEVVKDGKWIRRSKGDWDQDSPPVKDVDTPGKIFRRPPAQDEERHGRDADGPSVRKRPRISIHPQRDSDDEDRSKEMQEPQRAPETPRSPVKVGIIFRGVQAEPDISSQGGHLVEEDSMDLGKRQLRLVDETKVPKDLLVGTQSKAGPSVVRHIVRNSKASQTQGSQSQSTSRKVHKQTNLTGFLARSRQKNPSPRQERRSLTPGPSAPRMPSPSNEPRAQSESATRFARSGMPALLGFSGGASLPIRPEDRDEDDDLTSDEGIPPQRRIRGRHTEPILPARQPDPTPGPSTRHSPTEKGKARADFPSEGPSTFAARLGWQKQTNPQRMNYLRRLNGISVTETQQEKEKDWLKGQGLYTSPKRPGGHRSVALFEADAKKGRPQKGVKQAPDVNKDIRDKMIELQPSLAERKGKRKHVSPPGSSGHRRLDGKSRAPGESHDNEELEYMQELQQLPRSDGASTLASMRSNARQTVLETNILQSPVATFESPERSARDSHASSPVGTPEAKREGSSSPTDMRTQYKPETLMYAEEGKRVYAFETFVDGASKVAEDTSPMQDEKHKRSDIGSTYDPDQERHMRTAPETLAFTPQKSRKVYALESVYPALSPSDVDPDSPSTSAGISARSKKPRLPDAVVHPYDEFGETQPLDAPYDEDSESNASPTKVVDLDETQQLPFDDADQSDVDATEPLPFSPNHTDNSEAPSPMRPHEGLVNSASPSPSKDQRGSKSRTTTQISSRSHRQSFANIGAAWDGVPIQLESGKILDVETFDRNAFETMPQSFARQSNLNSFGFSGGTQRIKQSRSKGKAAKTESQQANKWKPLPDDLVEDLSEDEHYLQQETLPYIRAERHEMSAMERARQEALAHNREQAHTTLHRQPQHASPPSLHAGPGRHPATPVAHLETPLRSKRAVSEDSAVASSARANSSASSRRPLRRSSTNQSTLSSASNETESQPPLDQLRKVISTQARKYLDG